MRGAIIVLMVFGFLCADAHALIMVGRGNSPVRDQNWPAGALEVANVKSRLGWWEGPPLGGGQWTFLYRDNTETFQQALDLFGKINAPELKLIVRDGPHQGGMIFEPDDANADKTIDWELLLWNPQSFYRLNTALRPLALADSPTFGNSLPPPTITLYASPQRVDFSKLTIPKNVQVSDERLSADQIETGPGILGDVYDMLTSKPISGATVQLAKLETADGKQSYAEVATAQSDAAGHFRLVGFERASLRVAIRARGYARAVAEYERFDERTFRSYTVQLVKAAQLSGRVIDSSGAPLAGVRVRSSGVMVPDGRGYRMPETPEVTTGDDGRFVLENLPQGPATITTWLDGFYRGGVFDEFDVPSENLELTMSATGALKGRVLDPAGNLVGGGHVSIYPPGETVGKWGGSMTVKPDGTFEFNNVPPGEYFISTNPDPSLRGKDPTAKKFTVFAGQAAEVDVPAFARSR